MKEILIAPCGMNCSLCARYLAMQNDLKNKGLNKKYCPGCRPRGKNCTKDYLEMLIFQHFEIVLFFMLSVAVV